MASIHGHLPTFHNQESVSIFNPFQRVPRSPLIIIIKQSPSSRIILNPHPDHKPRIIRQLSSFWIIIIISRVLHLPGSLLHSPVCMCASSKVARPWQMYSVVEDPYARTAQRATPVSSTLRTSGRFAVQVKICFVTVIGCHTMYM